MRQNGYGDKGGIIYEDKDDDGDKLGKGQRLYSGLGIKWNTIQMNQKMISNVTVTYIELIWR